MRKQLLIILSAILAAVALSIFSSGAQPAQAQGLVERAVLQLDGTLGENGIYISDVSYSWLLPATAIPESLVGCESGTITQDTPANGLLLECAGQYVNGYFTGVLLVDGEAQLPIIHRDTTPPQITLVAPNDTAVEAVEGSTLYLEAIAQDTHAVTLDWDLDEDGTADALNPTNVPIPGNIAGSISPCWIVMATDAAGNESQLIVEVSIINVAPSIDQWVVPTMVAFGGTAQLEATVSDPGDHPLSAVVAWGDGNSEVVAVDAAGQINAEHTYTQSGDFLVQLTVDDGEGATTTEEQILNVLTESDSLDLTLDDVTTFVQDGTLTSQQGLLLSMPLQMAQFHFEADRSQPAILELNIYIGRRDFFVEWGILNIDEQLTPCFYIPDLILDGWVPEPT